MAHCGLRSHTTVSSDQKHNMPAKPDLQLRYYKNLKKLRGNVINAKNIVHSFENIRADYPWLRGIDEGVEYTKAILELIKELENQLCTNADLAQPPPITTDSLTPFNFDDIQTIDKVTD